MRLNIAAGVLALATFATGAQATDLSFTGAFNHDNDVQSFTFTVGSASAVTLRSWSYAGGINAQGDTIARGGFDPILAQFDGTGKQVDEQDDADCGAVAGDTVTGRCYDVNYTKELMAGTYTVTVQQFDNFANGPALADGFQYDGAAYQNFRNGFVDAAGDKRDAHWAFDILNVDTAVVNPPADVPEPASLALLGIGALAMVRRKRSQVR